MANAMKITHITNFQSRGITNGGANREEALAEFLRSRGADRILVRDSAYWNSKTSRLLRLPQLLRQVRNSRPDLIVTNYPSYPFFWQHKFTLYFVLAMFFARYLRQVADSIGATVVVDVMDLPVFQYLDLGLPMDLAPRSFRLFDKTVLRSVDQVWVCSHLLAETIRREYEIPQQRLRVVVNGANNYGSLPSEPVSDTSFRFVYCGSLGSERGIDSLVETFINERIPDAQLHLAGEDGEWIPIRFQSRQVVYHGALTDCEAAALARSCHAGLIYYPQRGYYHLAFATKLPFYVCNGLPVLCTNVRETGTAVRTYGVGQVTEIAEYGSALRQMVNSRATLSRTYGEAISRITCRLTWDSLYGAALSSLGAKNGQQQAS